MSQASSLISHISYLKSHISYLISHISYLIISYLYLLIPNAMTKPDKRQQLFTHLVRKGTLKQKVFRQTEQSFMIFRDVLHDISVQYASSGTDKDETVPVEFSEKGQFEVQIKFAGDVLVFMMHTNVFEFPRDHLIHKTSYVKENPDRSFCGVIHIYNFLRDTFKYRRINDIGYLIGRVFINMDRHFYIDGKRELRLIPNNFVDSVIDRENVGDIIEQAMRYTIDFDLPTPPYDQIKEVQAMEFLTTLDTMGLKTGKRLGFRFQADLEE